MTHPLIDQVVEGTSPTDLVQWLIEATLMNTEWVERPDGRFEIHMVMSGFTGVKTFVSPPLPPEVQSNRIKRRRAEVVLKVEAKKFSKGKTGGFTPRRTPQGDRWIANTRPFVKLLPSLDTPGFQLGSLIRRGAAAVGLPL